jgi:hypothetical protein
MATAIFDAYRSNPLHEYRTQAHIETTHEQKKEVAASFLCFYSVVTDGLP